MQELQFDYYRGMEAEQYTFYRIPKVLFTAECFKSLSCEAKVLYGLLLDRMSLSIKNRWFDEEDRVYIIFTVEDVMELLNCSRQKAIKNLAELDSEKGIGLIEKKRLGLGRPNVIYVKNFIIKEGPEHEEKELRFSKSNDTDINKTDLSDTEFSETEYSKTDFNDTESSVSAIHPNLIQSNLSISCTEPDVMGEMDAYRDIIREHISYECFQDGRYHRREDVDELVELMVEVMMLPDNGTVRVAGVEKPAALVKNRFMKLNHEHIEYILTCLGANTTKVGNIKAYLLTTLYNAPMTISNYYTAEVNHDLYGSG